MSGEPPVETITVSRPLDHDDEIVYLSRPPGDNGIPLPDSFGDGYVLSPGGGFLIPETPRPRAVEDNVEKLVPRSEQETLNCLEALDSAVEIIKKRGASAVAIITISPERQMATIVRGGAVDLCACSGALASAVALHYADAAYDLDPRDPVGSDDE